MKKLSSKKQILYDVLYTTLVGKEIEITESKNPTQIGLKGVIVHESKYDLLLQTKTGEKRIRKDSVVFKFYYQQQPLYMDGRLLFTTLQTRIKKVK